MDFLEEDLGIYKLEWKGLRIGSGEVCLGQVGHSMLDYAKLIWSKNLRWVELETRINWRLTKETFHSTKSHLKKIFPSFLKNQGSVIESVPM